MGIDGRTADNSPVSADKKKRFPLKLYKVLQTTQHLIIEYTLQLQEILSLYHYPQVIEAL